MRYTKRGNPYSERKKAEMLKIPGETQIHRKDAIAIRITKAGKQESIVPRTVIVKLKMLALKMKKLIF
jgi:hypothetical protein